MRPDLIADLFDKEERYWWYVTRRELVIALVRSGSLTGIRSEAGLVLDIGCGGGYLDKVLESSDWHVVGVDVSPDALQYCRRRGLQCLCRTDLQRCSLPFKAESFDMVFAMDVLEHVEDDGHALAECRRVLKDGGLLIVTVPAFMILWSAWDEACGHRRRYTGRQLARTAARAELVIVRWTYLFCFVLPAVVAIRLVKHLFSKDSLQYSTDFVPLPRAVNDMLVLLGRLERFLITKLRVKLPFGTSVVSVMTRK